MGIHITGVGSYIPSHKEKNQDFLAHTFLDDSGNPFGAENGEIIEKWAADSARKREDLALEEWAKRVNVFLGHVATLHSPSLYILF